MSDDDEIGGIEIESRWHESMMPLWIALGIAFVITSCGLSYRLACTSDSIVEVNQHAD